MESITVNALNSIWDDVNTAIDRGYANEYLIENAHELWHELYKKLESLRSEDAGYDDLKGWAF